VAAYEQDKLDLVSEQTEVGFDTKTVNMTSVRSDVGAKKRDRWIIFYRIYGRCPMSIYTCCCRLAVAALILLAIVAYLNALAHQAMLPCDGLFRLRGLSD
jgi:hypothetical protein